MENQEKIDRRLLNQMSKAEQIAFDKELKNNPDLSDSFDLNQDMADFFRNENPDLEGKLGTLGDKYFSGQASSRLSWYWLIPVVLLGGAALYFVSNTTEETSISPDTIEIEKSVPIPQNEDKTNESETEIIQTEKIKKKNEDKETREKKPDIYPFPKQDKEEIQPIFAANFEPVELIEDIISSSVRDIDVTSLRQPINGAILSNSTNLFVLEGTTDIKPPYELVIYNNNPERFDNGISYFKEDLSAEETEDGFLFNFRAKMTFSPGLYYLFVQKDDEPISISKFIVK